jgi:four helix bundle protein
MNEKKDSGPVPGSGTFTGTGTVTGTGTGTEQVLFDHEKLEVYRVAREFLQIAQPLMKRKISRVLRDQFERASLSIAANIAEGAGKTAWTDKQRIYEIARGSTTETATLLEVMSIRGAITPDEYEGGRQLLIRIAQMLSRLCGPPRRA